MATSWAGRAGAGAWWTCGRIWRRWSGCRWSGEGTRGGARRCWGRGGIRGGCRPWVRLVEGGGFAAGFTTVPIDRCDVLDSQRGRLVDNCWRMYAVRLRLRTMASSRTWRWLLAPASRCTHCQCSARWSTDMKTEWAGSGSGCSWQVEEADWE